MAERRVQSPPGSNEFVFFFKYKHQAVPALKLIAGLCQPKVAHHRVCGPDIRRNSEEKQITNQKNKNIVTKSYKIQMKDIKKFPTHTILQVISRLRFKGPLDI